MLRVVALVLALGVGFDRYAYDGKYTTAAATVLRSILRGL
jgi:hypothetical protein